MKIGIVEGLIVIILIALIIAPKQLPKLLASLREAKTAVDESRKKKKGEIDGEVEIVKEETVQ